ncbi:unnamed protein product [Phytophthora fragariaefolia]|uniref:Unnamed protein product n=1 Tax=Phytophthora fragariaefolia TaxID=1490495 RepID=A0A9W6XB32_9STRA|nr:unnamed protein product [Phytophthora fragariaefolia]
MMYSNSPTLRLLDLLDAFFKQALRRRMKYERISDAEALIAMEPGILDIFTVTDPELVDPKAIAWVKERIKQKCVAKGYAYSRPQWRSVWRYSKKPCLDRYFITEWNMFGIANAVVARMNNALERFNKGMNAAFKPHPNLREFVSTIAKMSMAYALRQSSITRGLRRKKQRRPRINLSAVPDLTVFQVPPDSGAEIEDIDDDRFQESAVASDLGNLSPFSDEEILGDLLQEARTAEDLDTDDENDTSRFDVSLDWEVI